VPGSVLPPFFLGLFADRGESSTILSRLFWAVLGPADIAFWAPRMAIPDVAGELASVLRSARGRFGASIRRGRGLSAGGRAGREFVRASTCDLLVDAPLVLPVPSTLIAGLSFVGASSCSIRKEKVVGHKKRDEKLPTANPNKFLDIVNGIFVLPLALLLSMASDVVQR
jgi:hypothetical protein